MKSRGIAGSAAFAAALVGLGWTALGALSPGEARAGCGDGACGRVDWTEVTSDDQGAPSSAKLHGGYAWESSPDVWATHPIGGTLSGYLWLSCPPASDPAGPACMQQLAMLIGATGTDQQIGFTGGYYDTVTGVAIRPGGLFTEGETGAAPVAATLVRLGGAAIHPAVCPAAVALPLSTGGASGHGGSGAGGNPTGAGGTGAGGNPTGSGGSGIGGNPTGAGASGGTPPLPADKGGCALAATRPAGDRPIEIVAVAALAFARRRRRD